MKEKVIFTLSLACFIGVMWFSSTIKDNHVTSSISEELITPLIESNTMEYIDDTLPETTHVDDVSSLISDVTTMERCLLKPTETDVFTFGGAFQYYRQCLGSDSSFQWQGSTYTTIRAEEVNIQIADSVQVKEETKKNNEVSETR